MDDIDQMIDAAVAAYVETPETTSEAPKGEEGAALPDQDTQAATAKDEAPEKAPEAAKGSGKVQELVDKKYGGDWDKFHEALFDNWNKSSELTNEVRDLKQQLLKKPEPTPEPVEDKSPELDWLNAHVANLDSKEKDNSAKQQKLITAYGKLEKDIAKLEGKLEAADELDKPRLEDRIERLRGDLERKQEAYQDLIAVAQRLGLDKQQAQANIGWVKDQLKQVRQQQLLERVAEQNQQKETLSEFIGALQDAAKEFRIPKENLKHMANVIRGEIAIHLRKLGPDAEAIDMPKAVKERAAAYAKAMGRPGVAPKVTTPARPDPNRPNVAANVQIPPSDKVKTAKDHAKYVDEVFKQFGLL